jgi:ElaB/YqjD/DUF883 family membrane-anchored ribosome-binding protein
MADKAPETTQEPGKAQNATRTSDMREQAREIGTQVQERAHQLGNQAREMGEQARDWAQEKGHQLQQGAQEASRQVRASASQLSNMGSEAMDQIEESLEDRIRYKPLQSVLIAAGAGMLLGLLLKK